MTDNEDQAAPPGVFKSKAGVKRIIAATGYSFAGLKTAWRIEHAFRQELLAVVPGTALALVLPVRPIEQLMLIGSLIFMLIVELINSAIEATVDRISAERHPLSKNAKDFGSAAVMLACLMALATWVVITWPLVFGH